MSVVRRDARRHWLIVATGILGVLVLPIAVAAWPVSGQRVDPVELRDRVLASDTQPYEGFIESTGRIGLPPLREFADLTSLLGGSTRLRAWYASASNWRVATIEPTGERDLYRAGAATYTWDFERNLVTRILGEPPVRLPWPADIVPPELARRVLLAAPDEAVTSIPARRVAGITAAGFRLTPHDPATTVGRVDIWADPDTGLPLQVEIARRGADRPVFVTRFLELSQEVPSASALVPPPRPPSAGFTTTDAPDVAAAINEVAAYPVPPVLAGRSRVGVPSGIAGVAAYGDGLSAFVALPLPGRLARQAIGVARDAGAQPVPIADADAFQIGTSLLTTLVVRAEGPRGTDRPAYLVAGLVDADLLRRAGAELLAAAR